MIWSSFLMDSRLGPVVAASAASPPAAPSGAAASDGARARLAGPTVSLGVLGLGVVVWGEAAEGAGLVRCWCMA